MVFTKTATNRLHILYYIYVRCNVVLGDKPEQLN